MSGFPPTSFQSKFGVHLYLKDIYEEGADVEAGIETETKEEEVVVVAAAAVVAVVAAAAAEEEDEEEDEEGLVCEFWIRVTG